VKRKWDTLSLPLSGDGDVEQSAENGKFSSGQLLVVETVTQILIKIGDKIVRI
jgi:hypothetical protein